MRPRPTWPVVASASPAPYVRTLPNRRTRSIAAGSRIGNICCRRVSMTDSVGAAIISEDCQRASLQAQATSLATSPSCAHNFTVAMAAVSSQHCAKQPPGRRRDNAPPLSRAHRRTGQRTTTTCHIQRFPCLAHPQKESPAAAHRERREVGGGSSLRQ